MDTNPDQENLSDRELALTRIFDAPPEKVFRAWTEPDLLTQWFAPLPWTTPRAELDVRPGGVNLIVMRSPEGDEYPNRGVYLEVVKNERLVFTDAYTCAWAPSEQPFMTVVITFEDLGGNSLHGRACFIGRSPIESDMIRWAFTRAGGNALISWANFYGECSACLLAAVCICQPSRRIYARKKIENL